ncbi:PepSY domain-containing protein [Streptococcus sp. CSL10205-OR2]|uniref:PepSY domain-containing protein n=1 Tax=Streptococcus sp. CSL10205-OR2 TaxID=2980558 RepID=UPI0021DABE48|nr:PepSY domain-containing protein [Streptococcus sp. CSL10205-OR2]MCU9533584.1 PepSY domain-containing protein [Streptococcus sp. CSL10205-OR2]
MEKTTKKWLMIGIVAVLIIALAGFAFGNGVFDNDSKMEEKVETVIDDDDSFDKDLDDGFDKKDESKKSNQSTLLLPIEIDFNTAMDIASTHAKTGFMTKAKIDIEENIPYYDIEIAENDDLKFYLIDANSGEIIVSMQASDIGYTVLEPKQTVKDIMTMIENKYKGAELQGITLEHDSPNPVYEVTIISDNVEKELKVNVADGSIISEEVDD